MTGKTVYSGWGFFSSLDSQPKLYVRKLEVVTTTDRGESIYRDAETGRLKDVHASLGEKLFDTEAEAWEAAAAQLIPYRDRIDAAVAEAHAKAAATRVGEAVPS